MEKIIKNLSVVFSPIENGILKACFILILSIPLVNTSNAQCTLSATVSVTAATCGVSNGKASVTPSGGSFPYKYLWSSGGNKANETGLQAGYYTCTITDKLNCQITVEAIVPSNTPITANPVVTNVSCGGNSDGAIDLSSVSGDVGPYTYSWFVDGSTNPTISGQPSGTYQCEITSKNGCVGIQSATISEPTPVVPTATKQNVSCGGTNDGSASVTVTGGTGPYTYVWSPGGAITSSISNLTTGTYNCTVTDNKGCPATTSVTITKPTPFTTSNVSTNVTCKGGSDGSATVTVTGGTAPFIYAWSPSGGASKSATNLKEGNYVVQVVDANGCTGSRVIKITAFSNIAVTPTIVNATTCTAPYDGSIALTSSGGKTPYTYSWTGSTSTSATRTSLAKASYAYTVTDNLGCKYNSTAAVSGPTCTEILPQTDITELSIYPNPARDHIKIESPYYITKVRLLDSKGRLVFEREGESDMTLPVLEKGIYFIQLDSEKGSIVKKLSIE